MQIYNGNRVHKQLKHHILQVTELKQDQTLPKQCKQDIAWQQKAKNSESRVKYVSKRIRQRRKYWSKYVERIESNRLQKNAKQNRTTGEGTRGIPLGERSVRPQRWKRQGLIITGAKLCTYMDIALIAEGQIHSTKTIDIFRSWWGLSACSTGWNATDIFFLAPFGSTSEMATFGLRHLSGPEKHYPTLQNWKLCHTLY